MSKSRIIPLIDIFYIAKQWILMVDSSQQQYFDQISMLKLELLDENLLLITSATIAFIPMGNRNPNIFDFAINPETSNSNIRTAKYIKLLKEPIQGHDN